jgi:aminoglycoside phosphotransferase (APT) family kinase protein
LQVEAAASRYFQTVDASIGWRERLRAFFRREPSLAFPESYFQENANGAVLVTPWLDGTSCEKAKSPPLKARELVPVGRFLAALHAPSPVALPPELASLLADTSDEALHIRFQELLETALEKEVLSSDETQLCSDVFEAAFSLGRVFAHGDLWEPNLLRGKDGRLWLLDAEYAKWALPGTDLVHFYFQTRVFRGNKRVAMEGFWTLYAAVQAVRPAITEEIWTTFLYGLAFAASRVELGTPECDVVRALTLPILFRDLSRLLAT